MGAKISKTNVFNYNFVISDSQSSLLQSPSLSTHSGQELSIQNPNHLSWRDCGGGGGMTVSYYELLFIKITVWKETRKSSRLSPLNKTFPPWFPSQMGFPTCDEGGSLLFWAPAIFYFKLYYTKKISTPLGIL